MRLLVLFLYILPSLAFAQLDSAEYNSYLMEIMKVSSVNKILKNDALFDNDEYARLIELKSEEYKVTYDSSGGSFILYDTTGYDKTIGIKTLWISSDQYLALTFYDENGYLKGPEWRFRSNGKIQIKRWWYQDRPLSSFLGFITEKECFEELYYKNGNIKKKGQYKNDFKVGSWTYFNSKGEVKRVKDYGSETKLDTSKRLGLYLSLDLAYRPSDKLRTEGASRRFSFGLKVFNKRRTVAGLVGWSFKAVKLNFISNSFQPDFLARVKDNYQPVLEPGLDQVIAQSMYELANGSTSYTTENNYHSYFHAGLQFNSLWLRPMITVYLGKESILLQGPLIQEESDYFNYSFAEGYNKFTEVKLGASLPLLKESPTKLQLNFNLGYQWRDYKNISFQGIALDRYTTGNIYEGYQFADNLTLSIGLIFATN